MTTHTKQDLERAAEIAERGEPTGPAQDATDLRKLAEAADDVRASEARVRELVQLSRAKGRSWTRIGFALGVSRQAARERFAEKIPA